MAAGFYEAFDIVMTFSEKTLVKFFGIKRNENVIQNSQN